MTNLINYSTPAVRGRSPKIGVILACIGMGCNVVAILLSVGIDFQDLWHVPPGTSIRPMVTVAIEFLLGGGMLLLSLILAIVGVALRWRWKRVWLLALLLIGMGVLPLCAHLLTFNWIVAEHRLGLES